jgi:hypothetical protein
MKNKFILDVACGARLFWFNKKHPNTVYCDKRVVPYHEYYKNRFIEINPDVVCDFTNLPFPDKSFKLVVFDPPHLKSVGENSWLYIKYGRLESNWPKMLKDGFNECMRVLENYGVLIFKWSEYQIPLSKILKVVDQEPLFGNKHPRQSGTHWLCFMKTQHHKH